MLGGPAAAGAVPRPVPRPMPRRVYEYTRVARWHRTTLLLDWALFTIPLGLGVLIGWAIWGH